jgi:hypothetical protein
MIPLGIFLLACSAVYLGAIDAAFSALMRLSLRLIAERTNRPGALGEYLDDPLLLFAPVRLLLGLVTGVATTLLARVIGVDAQTLPLVVVAVAVPILSFYGSLNPFRTYPNDIAVYFAAASIAIVIIWYAALRIWRAGAVGAAGAYADHGTS